MTTTRLFGLAFLLVVSTIELSSQRASSGTAPDVRTAVNVNAAVSQYCVSCHSERLKTAGLVLENLNAQQIGAHGDVWEKVVRRLRHREMPPAGLPRPDEATYVDMVRALEGALDNAAADTPHLGVTALRRLTRTEYLNAVRDLLGLEVDPSLLPEDVVQDGFDNMAGGLAFSPALADRYLAAARRISRLALGDLTVGPAFASATYHVSDMPVLGKQGHMGEDFPLGSRGGLAVRHYFPVDGTYRVHVTLQRMAFGYIRGLSELNEIEVRLDGRRITTFEVGGKHVPAFRPGTFMPQGYGGTFPPESPEWDSYMTGVDDGFTVSFAARAGSSVLTVSFVERRSEEDDGPPQPPIPYTGFIRDSTSFARTGRAQAGVETVAVSGPYDPSGPGDTASRRRVFVCRPGRENADERCARTIISTFARRAYRRPVTAVDMDVLLPFYRAGLADGGFEGGIREALVRVLASPRFLLKVEQGLDRPRSAAGNRISDLELASRLSFFLWSSIPDDELLDVAEKGRLSSADMLEQQVKRMLADRRSDALVGNFAAQWLELRRLEGVTPNPDIYDTYDEDLRRAFVRETEMFLADQMRRDRPLPELLTADYSFVNERLARHYGIPNVTGSRFRRVELIPSSHRGGLLTHGSILTLTSYGNRTSPVIRGKWLLDNILGTPPAPPPPDVPALPEGPGQGIRTVRERLETHRRNAVCARCHSRMDPFGFALENFDAVGAWRDVGEDRAPIDASAVLVDGTQFQGAEGLRRFLASRGDVFAGTATEKMLQYALGRPLEYFDMPVVRQILRATAPHQHRWSALVLGVVNSASFRMRKVEPS